MKPGISQHPGLRESLEQALPPSPPHPTPPLPPSASAALQNDCNPSGPGLGVDVGQEGLWSHEVGPFM